MNANLAQENVERYQEYTARMQAQANADHAEIMRLRSELNMERRARLEANRMLDATVQRAEHAEAELEKLASFTEPHYKGAGVTPTAEWIIGEWKFRFDGLEDELEAVAARAASVTQTLVEVLNTIATGQPVSIGSVHNAMSVTFDCRDIDRWRQVLLASPEPAETGELLQSLIVWIPTSERMPDTTRAVFILIDYADDLGLGWMEGYCQDTWYYHGDDRLPVRGTVRYWAEIPQVTP